MANGFLLGLDWGGGGVRALVLDVERGATTILPRMQHLLGGQAISALKVLRPR